MNKVISYKIGNKRLIIEENRISWENKLLDSYVNKPIEIRYGTAPIEVDMFTIGSNHKIELRDSEKNKITIAIKSLFGINRTKKFKLYQEICDVIWDKFFSERFGEMVNDWENGKKLKIGKYEIDPEGIKIYSRNVTIYFSEMELIQRIDHLLINSNKEQNKYIRLYYLDDWNWSLIQEILFRAKKWNKPPQAQSFQPRRPRPDASLMESRTLSVIEMIKRNWSRRKFTRRTES